MSEKLPVPDKNGVMFLPLGGCGHFGANLNLYGYGGAWIAVDCGMGFADERLPGVDVILPDPALIAAQADKLKALFVTHAHEDHIGGIAWLWPQLKCPIYAGAFTAALLKRKFEEHEYAGARPKIHIVKDGDTVKVGDFEVTYIPVAHSIPEGNALKINTPEGVIVHTGDWCLDGDPILGRKTDAKLFETLGAEGVLACMGDSTNAEVTRPARSEREVEAGLTQVIEDAPGRVAITVFASNIGRILSIHRAAKAAGRHVGLVGRSLYSMVEAAKDTGYMPKSVTFISEEDIMNVAPHKLVLIATGSQGEGRAALARMAKGNHPNVKLKPNDTVVFSSRAIPGNEVAINDIKNSLLGLGVNIITDKDAPIHVSGHPVRADIEKMLGWLKPEILIPVHGERTQMEAHADIGREVGIKSVHVPANGELIRLKSGRGAVVERALSAGFMAVDLDRVVPASHITILERRKVSFNGAVFVSLSVDQESGEVLDCRVSAVGILDPENASDVRLLREVEDNIADAYEAMPKAERLSEHAGAENARITARRFFRELFDIRPLMVVHLALV